MKPTQIATALLGWYDREHRRLPWRVPPMSGETPDPYRVWLSEIMLQQTTVVAVIPYFEAFIARWPDVAALAAAEDAEVMAAWAGLGYYARARNMLACARAVGSAFPRSETELRALPGIGPYTAAAIAAIAFGERAVVVDGNVERVTARLFAVDAPLRDVKPRLYALTDAITPDTRPGDFAQAMMDLGATLCRPRTPDCNRCPIQSHCAAYAAGRTGELPARSARAARPVRHGTAYWIEDKGRVLLVRRPTKGLLGGMLALPSSDFTDTAPVDGQFPGLPDGARDAGSIGQVRHVFSHFELRLDVRAADVLDGETFNGHWIARCEIRQAGLPTVFRKAIDAALDKGEQKVLS